MRSTTLLLIIIALANLVSGCGEDKPTVPENWKKYKNFSYKFQFYYPPNWALSNTGHENLVFNLASERLGEEDMIQENVNMVSIPIPAGVNTLEDFLPTVEQLTLDHFIEPKELLNEKTEFAGKDAIVQRFSAVVNETPVIWEQWIMFVNNDALIWTFAAESARFDQYKDTTDMISSTFVFN